MMTSHTDDPSQHPLVMSWEEFALRLREAGWTQAEVEKHIADIQSEQESGVD